MIWVIGIKTHTHTHTHTPYHVVSQVALVIKNPPVNARDVRDAGSTPGSGRAPGEGNGNILQYSCLGNPGDKVGWGGLQSIASHSVRRD